MNFQVVSQSLKFGGGKTFLRLNRRVPVCGCLWASLFLQPHFIWLRWEFLLQCREAESPIVKTELWGPKGETWGVERRKPDPLGQEVWGREERERAQWGQECVSWLSFLEWDVSGVCVCLMLGRVESSKAGMGAWEHGGGKTGWGGARCNPLQKTLCKHTHHGIGMTVQLWLEELSLRWAPQPVQGMQRARGSHEPWWVNVGWLHGQLELLKPGVWKGRLPTTRTLKMSCLNEVTVNSWVCHSRQRTKKAGYLLIDMVQTPDWLPVAEPSLEGPYVY